MITVSTWQAIVGILTSVVASFVAQWLMILYHEHRKKKKHLEGLFELAKTVGKHKREYDKLEVFVNKIASAVTSHTGKTINGIDYRTEEG